MTDAFKLFELFSKYKPVVVHSDYSTRVYNQFIKSIKSTDIKINQEVIVEFYSLIGIIGSSSYRGLFLSALINLCNAENVKLPDELKSVDFLGFHNTKTIQAKNVSGNYVGYRNNKVIIAENILGHYTGKRMSGKIISKNIRGDNTGKYMTGEIRAENIDGDNIGSEMKGKIEAKIISGESTGYGMLGGKIIARGRIEGNRTGDFMKNSAKIHANELLGNYIGVGMSKNSEITAKTIIGNSVGFGIYGRITAHLIKGYLIGASIELSGKIKAHTIQGSISKNAPRGCVEYKELTG